MVLDGSAGYGSIFAKDAAGGIRMASVFPLNVLELWAYPLSLRSFHGGLADSPGNKTLLHPNPTGRAFLQLRFKNIIQCISGAWIGDPLHSKYKMV